MLKRRRISLRTEEERAQARSDREEREREERERILQELDDWNFEDRKPGPDPKVLPEDVARRVLADVNARHSYRAIARKYVNTPWAFSHMWLWAAVKDGRLERMAGLVPVS